MANFFLPEISAAQKQVLETKKIAFVDFRLSLGVGIVVGAAELPQALAALNIVAINQEATEIPEMIWQSWRAKPKPQIIVRERWRRDDGRTTTPALEGLMIAAIEKHLVPAVTVSTIELFFASGGAKIEKSWYPEDKDVFRIFFFCSPHYRDFCDTPGRLFGIPVNTYWRCLCPAPDSVVSKDMQIFDPENKRRVAELIDQNLFILWPCFAQEHNERDDSGQKVFEIILQRVVETLFVEDDSRVTTRLFSPDIRKRLRDITQEELVLILGRDVEVCNGVEGNLANFPRKGKTFQIFNKLLPGGVRVDTFTLPSSLWGIQLRKSGYNDRSCFLPGYLGYPIKDDKTGTVVAEVTEDALYIFFDITWLRFDENEEKVYRKILAETCAFFRLAPEERKNAEKFWRATWKAHYVALCSRRGRKELEDAEKNRDRLRVEVTDLRIKLQEALKALERAEVSLAVVQARVDGQIQTELEMEFDKLFLNPKIRDVQVDRDRKLIQVFTYVLTCIDPRNSAKYEIGEFRIEIHLGSSGEDCVRFFNLTRQVDGGSFGDSKMQAPHVNIEGKACLGTASKMICELFAQQEFSPLMDTAIKFLETVNTQDTWGKYITNWPLVRS